MAAPERTGTTGLPTSWRRDDIQGLRAIAVLLVVAFHAGLPIPGGFVGVDVFFVISGFVITELVLREMSSTTGFRLRTFYSRRLKRLLPALALMVSVVLIASIALQSPFGAQQVTAQTGLGAVFFVANFVVYLTTGGYFDAPAEFNPLLHTWSLSVEEQFYFVFPSAMIFAWWLGRRMLRGRSRLSAVLLLSAMSVASFSMSILMSFGWWEPSFADKATEWAFYSSVTRAWEFAAGALLALALARWPALLRGASAELASATGALLILLSAMIITGSMPFPGMVALLPVIGTALVIAGGTAKRTAITTALQVPLMVWIGALSYSWYLWHWPVIVFARDLAPTSPAVTLIAAAGSLLPAWLAFRWVEDPIRRNNSIRGARIFVLVALCMTIPSIIAIILLTGARSYWGSTAIESMAVQVAPLPVSYERGCDDASALGRSSDSQCTWNTEATGEPIYVIGDSQAGQLAEAVIAAGDLLGRPVTIADLSSCAFLLPAPGGAPVTDERCEAYVRDSIAYLEDAPTGSIVLAISPNYVTPEGSGQFTEDLVRAVDPLTRAGHDVRIVRPVPQFPEWSPTACSLWDAITDAAGCGVQRTADEERARLAAADTAFLAAASRTGASTIDLFERLCQEGLCRTNRGDEWVYRDSFHITVGESARLTPLFADALSSND